MWRGIWSGKGRSERRGGVIWSGGEFARVRKSRVIRGRSGIKKGMERKCYMLKGGERGGAQCRKGLRANWSRV